MSSGAADSRRYPFQGRDLLWRLAVHRFKADAGLREQAPITYASKIQAPTLIMSDTLDQRVPITESFMLYHALRDNGVETKFIAYPVSGHFPSDPIHRRDIDRRWAAWLRDHLEPRQESR